MDKIGNNKNTDFKRKKNKEREKSDNKKSSLKRKEARDKFNNIF